MNTKSPSNEKKNLLSKQKLLILVLGVCVVLLAGAYLAVSLLKGTKTLELPLYDADGDRVEYTYSAKSGNRVTVLENDGETLKLSADSEITYQARPLIFPEIPQDNLNSVSVTNASGTYTLQKDSTGAFVFVGNEMLLYDEQSLSNLKF